MSNEKETLQTEEKVVENKSTNKVVEVKAKNVAKKKKDKVKKPSKVGKALKDTGAELKKVSWPKFKEVVKQTGIVLVVVLVFTLVIFGVDRLCSWLTGLLF
ncbi:MAG: preprotein translocase subunit SecE [Clostridia bacterium]